MVLVLVGQPRQDPVHQLVRPDVVPRDGVVQRLASQFVPHHSRFPLIGHAQRDYVRGTVAQELEVRAGLGDALLNGAEQLLRVLLDPALLRTDLRDLDRVRAELL